MLTTIIEYMESKNIFLFVAVEDKTVTNATTDAQITQSLIKVCFGNSTATPVKYRYVLGTNLATPTLELEIKHPLRHTLANRKELRTAIKSLMERLDGDELTIEIECPVTGEWFRMPRSETLEYEIVNMINYRRLLREE